MIDWGYRAQRLAHRRREALRARRRRRRGGRRRPSAGAPLKAQVIHFINKPMPGGLPKRTSRALLDIEDDAVVPIIRDPAQGRPRSPMRCSTSPAAARSGCSRRSGSRRRRCSTTSARRRVLPPGYLCCGYPQTAVGRPRRGPADHHRQPRAVPPRRQHAQLPRHQDRDRVLRHLHGPAAEVRVRARSSPAAACSTSTSTCWRRASQLEGVDGRALHVPRPLPHADEDVRAADGRQRADGRRRCALNDRCCGESGTLAMTRPDISTQVRFRKEEEMRARRGRAARRRLRRRGEDPHLLPVVPAGAVALRRRRRHRAPTTSSSRWRGACSGDDWMADYVARANAGGIERVLV